MQTRGPATTLHERSHNQPSVFLQAQSLTGPKQQHSTGFEAGGALSWPKGSDTAGNALSIWPQPR